MQRNSNLELYRIIVMMLIVAHHYVVSSGLLPVLREAPLSGASVGMLLMGAWGKTGINCFVMITGYYMCRKQFSWRKLLRLYLQITFYAVVIYSLFYLTGSDEFHPMVALMTLFPVSVIDNNFVGCFLVFYMLIPFLNILVGHLTRRQHRNLLCLLLILFTLWPLVPTVFVRFNYVEWFIVLYVLASYLRFYGDELRISHKQWGRLAVASLLVSSLSVVVMTWLGQRGENHIKPYHLLQDSNMVLAVTTAVASFMWFKDLKLRQRPWINALGATTFGVLLIHDNCDAMRQWLWRDTVDCVGHYSAELLPTLGYALCVVLLVFFGCSFIEYIRQHLVERTVGIIERVAFKGVRS